jgi:phenylalanyl-tRNA synthetase alpha chain
MEVLEKIKNEFLEKSGDAKTSDDAENLRIEFLGRNGKLTNARKNINFKELSAEEKKNVGSDFNTLKELIEEKLKELSEKGFSKKSSSLFDASLPGDTIQTGSIHPITLVQMEIEEIFSAMGFMVLDGYEVESEYYNFESVNIPKDHPARDMQDTFFLENGMILRTHTSACQVRTMEKYKPPFRAIFPGKCFRYEALDASHENTFFQLEGLMVDKVISISHLIAVMKTLLSEIFKRDVKVRLRPGYFPFVEPGFELDIQCLICGGEGCSTCKKTGWIELLPCGLVHPRVLEAGGINPREYMGFAFGLGLTRLAMMKYGINDIRWLNSGDLRVMKQFTPAG